MRADVAVIGRIEPSFNAQEALIKTAYGPVRAFITEISGRAVLFVSRHGDFHLPPHKINYRAIIEAVAQSGARRIVSVNTVGSMTGTRSPFFLPVDFVEFTTGRPNTFHENRAVHVDLTEPYCPEVRQAIQRGVKDSGLQLTEGVYACTQGPHLETKAQIRMLRQFADVVGMTGYPEVVLAREAGICYASLCLVTNLACGLGDGHLIAYDVALEMERWMQSLSLVVSKTVEAIPENRSCCCGNALDGAFL